MPMITMVMVAMQVTGTRNPKRSTSSVTVTLRFKTLAYFRSMRRCRARNLALV